MANSPGNKVPIRTGTNIYGDGNETYNNSVIHNYSDRPAYQSSRPGIEILADSVAHTALHSSSSRNIRTGCLEGTSVGITDELVRWIENPWRKYSVCWVYGGAGVGKSAVSQTVCEIARRKAQLAASFFFWRNDAERSTLDRVFATISHQLATLPELQTTDLPSLIGSAVAQSRSGLQGMNLEGQFQALIHRPCAQIDADKWKTLPKLIVIDGLDECMGGSGVGSASHAQETLLTIIKNAISADSPIPLLFMIFSRPEHTIVDFFQASLPHYSVDMRKYRSEADGDIRRYLQKEFASISRSHLEMLVGGTWPGTQATEQLVQKADGHFIYVVTAMKYITANRPSAAELRERLDIVLRIGESTSHPDLSDLDQLYHAILRPFAHETLRQVLLPILQLIITSHPASVSFGTPKGRSQRLIAALLGIDPHQCSDILSLLRSVLHVPNGGKNEDVTILHASFTDFLGAEYRSHNFHIQPLNTVKYLDLVSSRLLSSLASKVSQYRRRESWAEDPVNWNLPFDLWSLNPWSFVDVLMSISAKQPTLLSDGLVSTLTNFNAYEYLNMLLDEQYMNASHLANKFSRSAEDGSWGILAGMVVFRNSRNSDPAASLELYPLGIDRGRALLHRAQFVQYTFRVLLITIVHLRGIHYSFKSILQQTNLRPFYDHLNQFFEGDWLIVSSKDRRESWSRLGSLVLPASIGLRKSGVIGQLGYYIVGLPMATGEKRRIQSTLKVLPQGEMERARREFDASRYEVHLVSSQQRTQLAEEIAKPIRSDGTVSTATIENLAISYLTGTVSGTPSPKADSEESNSEQSARLRFFRGTFRRSS